MSIYVQPCGPGCTEGYAEFESELKRSLRQAGYRLLESPSQPHDVLLSWSGTDWDANAIARMRLRAIDPEGRVLHTSECYANMPKCAAIMTNEFTAAPGMGDYSMDLASGRATKSRPDLRSPSRPTASPDDSRAHARSPAPLESDRPPSKSSAPPRAQGEVIALFDLEDVGASLSARDVDQLTEYFAVQLSAVGYKVVPRSQLRERLSEAKEESYKACYDESCQIDLGKAVAAQKSIASKLLRVGSTCALTATLYDLRSETTERAASVDTQCEQHELFGGLRELASRLVSNS